MLGRDFMNQALSVPCSDPIYIERDSSNIEILRKAEKLDILFLLEVIFFIFAWRNCRNIPELICTSLFYKMAYYFIKIIQIPPNFTKYIIK